MNKIKIPREILLPAVIILILILIFVFALGIFVLAGVGKVVQTTDLVDYGVISGNYDNDAPAKFIFSFFPEEISDDFSNVSYRYTAQKGDTHACEIWLEFDIEDKERYQDFIQAYSGTEWTGVFQYDTDYWDYTVSNDFYLTNPKDDKPGNLHIEYAQIGKVLFCDDTQHIIFYALCIFDGGYASTQIFGDFFTRFGIDPVEYEASAALQSER